MDFVSRHTTAPSDNQPPTPSASSAAPPEEPEYLARYMVIKHSWRGRYKRILCISSYTITTLDPGTLSVTNSYDVGSDFEGANPIIGRDEHSNEFNISVRTDGRGKFKSVKFSSKYRASILTELHRIRWNRLATVAEFPVLHLRRRNSEWVSYVGYMTTSSPRLVLLILGIFPRVAICCVHVLLPLIGTLANFVPFEIGSKKTLCWMLIIMKETRLGSFLLIISIVRNGAVA